MKFTGNNRQIQIAIGLLLVLYALGALGFCARAEAQTVGVSVGAAFIGSERCDYDALNITAAFSEERWIAGLSTHGEGMCRSELVSANIAAWISRSVKLGDFRIGFGAGVREHGDIAVGSYEVTQQPEAPRIDHRPHMVAAINVRYMIGERLMLEVLHFSNGGSTLSNNPGKHGANPGFNGIYIGGRF